MIWAWPACCWGSPGASPPARRARSAACSSRRGTTSCRSSPPQRSGSSPPKRSARLRGARPLRMSISISRAPTCCSWRMGVSLAAEARRRGAHVTLLGANLAVPAPPGIEVVDTPTAGELEREALARGSHADVVIMAAAVADYRPAEALATKRPKDRSGWTVELEPTVDVLATLGAEGRPGQLLVGFAADQGELGLQRARQKLTNKNADLFVFNDVGRDDIGFDARDNEVTLVSAAGERLVAKASKPEVAAAILDEVERLLG